MKKIAVIIPCFNEGDGIAAVIRAFPREKLALHGFELDILVIDNNSTDRTAELAKAAGARVIHEPKQGKGNAIRTGFYNIPDDTDYVVMLDGDDTYKPAEILRLIEPLESGFSEVIIGSRLGGKMKKGSMRGFNRLGNWLFSFLVRIGYQVNVTDALTGYFAWKKEAIYKLRPHLNADGFAIEMEMITKMARLGYDIYSVPISYEPRQGLSSLHPLRDGSRILMMYLRQLYWHARVQRIAFVSDAVYPFNKGGKEKRLYEVSRRLVKEGREVHIYTMKWWDGPKTITQDGVQMHAISKLHPLYKDNRRSIAEAAWFSLACFKLLREKFDVIDVDHMPFFPLFTVRIVCWLRRKRMFATWHEVWGREYWSTYLNRGGLIATVTEYLAFKMPDVIISNSAHTTRQLHKMRVKKPIETIPLGVDVDMIFTAPVHQISSDVIYAGRLLDHKNVDLLVRAIALVKKSKPDISCIIVGNGPERDHLQELIAELKLKDNVTLFNFVEDQSELHALMKASKTLVLPSIREGFSLTVIEANACGLPVITTSHEQNAARDLIIEGENGLLTQANHKDLAKQILKILDGTSMKPLETLLEQFGQYRWSTVSEQIEEVFSARL